MNGMNMDDHDAELMLEEMAAWAVRSDPDRERFLARVEREAGRWPMFDGLGFPAGERDRPIRLLAAHIWHQLPLPSRGFKPEPLPAPGRNEPCPCGSGRKFKQCCGPLMRELGDFRLPPELAMMLVLDAAPVRVLKQAHEHAPHDWLAAIAHEWLDDGEAERALALLEPIAKRDDADIAARSAPAINMLYELYDALEHPRKKKRLLERMRAHPDKTLRSDACQRLAAMLTDQGRDDEARRLFSEAQRLTPDDPALAGLELLMMRARGEDEARIRERGEFWLRRLRRMNRDGDLDFAIEQVRDLMEQRGPFQDIEDDDDEALDEGLRRLRRALCRLPLPDAPLERLEEADDSLVLAPANPKADRLLARWMTCFPMDDDPWADPAWIELLEECPELRASFRVLDDVHAAVMEAGPGEVDDWRGIIASLALPLIDDVVPADEDRPIRWSWLENRPLLRVMFFTAGMLDAEERMALYEWMLVLNPNDNQGIRGLLMHLYLARGEDEAAAELGERYDDDILAEVNWNRALALFRLGRREEADAALDAALKKSPRVARALLDEDMPMPEFQEHEYGVILGGDEEAWQYREDARRFWLATPGAMAWLAERAKRRG